MESSKRFVEKIRKGGVCIGVGITFTDATATEALCDLLDFVWIDMEHNPLSLAAVQGHLMAVKGTGVTPLVRVPWNDPVLIKRILDIGAQALLIPFVQNAEEARRAVAACRYPPAGIRGITTSGRGSHYGRVTDYLKKADAEICVLLQVETGEALARIEEIASVDGVDGVFIGPSDLSASLGHIGNSQHPEVQAAIEDAVRRLTAIGKPAGILTSVEAEARRYIDWGYRFVAVGTDLGLLARNADALARGFKS